MNINQVIKKTKESLGLTKYLRTSYDDKAIYDIIVTHALRDWSYYFRYEFDPGTVHFDDNAIISPDCMVLPVYLIESAKRSDVSIEDVKSLRFTTDLYDAGQYNLSIYPAFRDYLSSEQMFAGQSLSQQQGDIDLFKLYRYSCWLEKPNTLRFNYPIMDGYISHGNRRMDNTFKSAQMSLYTTQAPNLIGISPGREPYFLKLCRLHVMRIIYENEVKYMESISSGQGNINLKVEEWAQAGAAIDELLRQLEGFSGLSQQGAVTF